MTTTSPKRLTANGQIHPGKTIPPSFRLKSRPATGPHQPAYGRDFPAVRAPIGPGFLNSQRAILWYNAAVICDAALDELLDKVWAGGRVSPCEALRLYNLPLEELGALSD